MIWHAFAFILLVLVTGMAVDAAVGLWRMARRRTR